MGKLRTRNCQDDEDGTMYHHSGVLQRRTVLLAVCCTNCYSISVPIVKLLSVVHCIVFDY